jgi:hypothetical protein
MSSTAYTIGKQENLIQGHYAVQHVEEHSHRPWVGIYMKDGIRLCRINGVLYSFFGSPAVMDADSSVIIAKLEEGYTA